MPDEMTEKEFISAQFFTAENEMPKAAPKRKRRSLPADVRALHQFARACDRMDPVHRRAAIQWLINAYLDGDGR